MTLRRSVVRLGGALREYLRHAPGTYVYLLVLLVTTLTVRSLDAALAQELLRTLSTNLYQMGRSAGRVLFVSAFLLGGQKWFETLLLFSLVYAPVERRVGTWRWLTVAAVGHVGATLVTTIGIWADVRYNRGAAALTRTIDVGVSYGFFATAAFGVFLLPRRWWTWAIAGGLFTYLGVRAFSVHSFTDAGHLAAACLGAALYPVLAPMRTRPVTWTPNTAPSP